MPKSNVDVKSIVKESKEITVRLKDGIVTSKLSKADKTELISDLEEVVALAENLKADIIQQKNDNAED